MKKSLPLVIALAATQAQAELDAHEHGVGVLNIAADGNTIAMELIAPGADIVGFEYEASSEEDHAAIDAAVEVLEDVSALFELPAAAGCMVKDAHAMLAGDEDHDDHEGEEHDDHKAEDHDDHDHEAEGHDDHAEDEHDDHDDHDDGHDEHDHDDHADHEDEEGHTEFHAEYVLECADTSALNQIGFPYFAAFPNALELDVQVVTSSGAQAFEVERDQPTLDLGSLF